ncbi:MAG: NAD(P)(+) transhydrogenase (Re/Si-specific) subunit beta, partial [Planctomycetota bacterium]|nr:NAD(P)(+) transhydrogenase (Re/Si-specific) subunit beta [Planctomycetota bacterium]
MENLLYLLSACLLIIGLKMLGSPKTAVRGNAIGAVGMLIAAGVALLLSRDAGGAPLEISREALIAIGVGLAAGALVGIIASQKVQMTAMPQMVALFNGLGGAASALVATIDLFNKKAGTSVELTLSVPAALSVLIGGVTLTGSAIAFAKLQGLIGGRPLVYPLQKPLNLLLLLGAIASCCWLAAEPLDPTPLYCLAGVAAILGILSVLPIGGADMPVVISLLNSYSGLAASAAGFVLGNNILIIAG